MSDEGLPSLLDRHWAESALAIGAVVIAAVSLWVAYDTERTNRELVASEQQLVAASSWPSVQIQENDSVPGGADESGLSLMLTNEGIGPAKLESFELFWKGQPQRSLTELVHSCCAAAGPAVSNFDASYGSTNGIVLRPGQTQDFIVFPRNARNQALLAILSPALRNLSFRYCYCSAFNDCWLATDIFQGPKNLSPPQVRICPRPAVSYNH